MNDNLSHQTKRKRKQIASKVEDSSYLPNTRTQQRDPHHPLSIYRHKPIDFAGLASLYPDFAVAWNAVKHRQHSKNDISFNSHVDSDFNVALTRALLKEDFGLNLPCMPKGYLCPPVPNRLNYVCWLKQLLTKEREIDTSLVQIGDDDENFEIPNHARGIDIGTGASCIYPLLLCKNFTTENFVEAPREGSHNNQVWKFLATDIDDDAITSAMQNVAANKLDNQILLCRVPPAPGNIRNESNAISAELSKKDNQGPIMSAIRAAENNINFFCSSPIASEPLMFDFCMTNPPFYSSYKEASTDRIGDGRKRTDMTFGEGVYYDGEVGFVSDMISDSLKLRNRITWYSSMVGRKSSLTILLNKLQMLGFVGRGNVVTTEFLQGKTTRWGIAWTFLEVPSRLSCEFVTKKVILGALFMHFLHQTQLLHLVYISIMSCRP